MRILFSTCSGANYMAPPRLADEQINCGPFFRDCEIGGRYFSLETPKGEYDLASVASRLPADQQPDAVVCLVDASWFNTPRNLAAFKCPRIALVADTHHMKKPIMGMIQYLLSQPFDRIVFLYTRHHLEFFREAGLKNLFWFPGLTFPHADSVVQAARVEPRQNRIALIGQAGNLHQRRLRLAGALAGAGLPLVFREASQREGLEFYGTSLLGFNATANADLNLRVFEIMASGSAMLMDRLAPASGMGALWQDGRDYAGYSTAEELVERARFYTEHPDQARAIGAAGAKWFDTHFNDSRRRADFASLAFDGRPAPLFGLETPRRTLLSGFGNSAPHLTAAIRFYEHLQHLHSTAEQVLLLADDSAPEGISQVAATLPRVRVVRRLAELEVADFLVTSTGRARSLTKLEARGLWCWDATAADVPELSARFKGAGMLQPREDLACFELPAPAAPVDKLATDARRLLTQCDFGHAFELARRALQENPHSLEALLVMAELALEGGKTDLFAKMIARAREVAPDEPRIPLLELSARVPELRQRPAERLLTLALRHVSGRELPAARAAAQRALTTDAKLAPAWFWLGQIAMGLAEGMAPSARESEIAAALHNFRRATELAPRNPGYWREFAQALHRVGLLDQAARAFERAGEADSSDLVSCLLGAQTLLRLGQPERAARLAESALEQAPTHRPLLLALANARKCLGLPAGDLFRQCCSECHEPASRPAPSRRVILLVQSPQEWVGCRAVHAALAGEPAISVLLAGDHSGIPAGERSKFLDWGASAPLAGDVVILQQPSDAGRPAAWCVKRMIAAGAQLVYLRMQPLLGGAVACRADQFNSLLDQAAALVVVASETLKREYAEHCLAGAGHVQVAVPEKISPPVRVAGAQARAWAGGRPIVTWIPSADVRLDRAEFGAGYSTFLRWADFMEREMAGHCEMAFHVHLDSRLADRLHQTGATDAGWLRQYADRLSALPNVRVEFGSGAWEEMPEADALIADAAAGLLAFAATGRPALLLLNPHGPELPVEFDGFGPQGLTASHGREIRAFLDSVSAGIARRFSLPDEPDTASGKEAWGDRVREMITGLVPVETAEANLLALSA
jgi:tetratricopeptide (TPR) repeat protein